uniref:SFRICE_003269 n=1 Tax=Spodoptera frugiperda TaxID=7108 RepID=A0A2H1VJR3_SPOFR
MLLGVTLASRADVRVGVDLPVAAPFNSPSLSSSTSIFLTVTASVALFSSCWPSFFISASVPFSSFSSAFLIVESRSEIWLSKSDGIFMSSADLSSVLTSAMLASVSFMVAHKDVYDLADFCEAEKKRIEAAQPKKRRASSLLRAAGGVEDEVAETQEPPK